MGSADATLTIEAHVVHRVLHETGVPLNPPSAVNKGVQRILSLVVISRCADDGHALVANILGGDYGCVHMQGLPLTVHCKVNMRPITLLCEWGAQFLYGL
jgi:hypothetical protein